MKTIYSKIPRLARRFFVLFMFWTITACVTVDLGLPPRGYAIDAPVEDTAEAAFSFTRVETEAKRLAAAPFAPPEQVPDFLRALSWGQWNAIRYHAENGKNLGIANSPFSLRFLHPGFIFTQIVPINIITADGIHPVPFVPELFEVDDEDLAAKLRQARLGYAGFNLMYAGTTADADDDDGTLGLMGSAHFQFRGRKARFGGDARPVALDTAVPSGELHPFFREYWLRQPENGEEKFVIYALMDSPEMTGAVEMTVTLGTARILDVRATFFKRDGVAWPVKIGLAPATGMFMFSEATGGDIFDYRPEVHKCDGLLMAAGGDDWHWVPLKNPQRLAIGSFNLNHPRGFGLLQRDTAFDHYQDLYNRYERCTSVWIEPKGDWGAGRIELVEIPTDKDYQPNIMAYWIAGENSPLWRGSNGREGAAADDGDAPVSLEYRMYWLPPNAPLHEVGTVQATRIARSPDAASVMFVVDFAGEVLDQLPADIGLTSVVDAPREAPLLDKTLVKNEVTGGWRLVMTFGLPQGGVLEKLLTARDGPTPLQFSAYLKRGENLADVLTEKWVYNFIP